MLQHLKKYFSTQVETTPAEALEALADISKEVNMAGTQEQPEMAVEHNNTAELVAQLASKDLAFAELSAKFAEMQAQMASIEAAKEQLVAEAAAKKLAHRKESLEMAVGTDKAPSLLASLEVLDDAAFEAVVASMSAGLDREAKTSMFVEKGLSSKEEIVPATHAQNLVNFIKNK
jgi:hypothetical protein